MRKLLVITLALVLVMAFAMPASAAIRNTIHDFQSGRGGTQTGFGIGGNRGMCSYCHIPHSALGDRLWPQAGTSSQPDYGLVGQLCSSCHLGGMANRNAPVDTSKRDGDVFTIDEVNHVLVDDAVYGNDTDQTAMGINDSTQFNQVSIWPYCTTEGIVGTPQMIECSSCHNPHNQWPDGTDPVGGGQSVETDETNYLYGRGNDYLRAAMYNTTTGVAFCEFCHEEKTRGGPAGNVIGSGTHPVGTTANAVDAAQVDIHIESAERITVSNLVSARLYDMNIDTDDTGAVAYDNGPGTHLTSYDSGGVTCQTCHMVHGAPNGLSDTNDVASSQGNWGNSGSLAASDDGYANILAVENDSNGGTFGGPSSYYTYPTERRTSGDYNDLCIDCHETTPSVGPNNLNAYNTNYPAAINATDILAYQNDTAADDLSTAGHGFGVDAHPVNIAPDGFSESGFDLTVQDPGWTDAARWAGEDGTPLWENGTADYDATNLTVAGRWTGTGAPSNRSEIVCLTCHSIHTGKNGTPILRVANSTICQDCHEDSLGTVSHPVNTGSAMQDNPDGATWPNNDSLPLANYYSGSGGSSFNQTAPDDVTDMACFTCHAAHDGVDGFMLRVPDDNSRICTGCHTDFIGGDENPSNYISEYGEAPGSRLGSHYTGTVTDSESRVGETRWAYSGTWTATTSSPGQTGHWNGGASAVSRLQCQSCHTPHNAASGLVEANSYDGNTTDTAGIDWYNASDTGGAGNETGATNYSDGGKMCNTPTSALLLGDNSRSNICATCHWPSGTHVTTIYTTGAKPDPKRATNETRRYRDYCSRTEKFIITILHPNQEQIYNVYDLLADLDPWDGSTPESPTNFPPVFVGVLPTNNRGEMVCDSCHAPHGAASGAGAFILEDGSGDGTSLTLARQRVDSRNFDDLCWLCHDK